MRYRLPIHSVAHWWAIVTVRSGKAAVGIAPEDALSLCFCYDRCCHNNGARVSFIIGNVGRATAAAVRYDCDERIDSVLFYSISKSWFRLTKAFDQKRYHYYQGWRLLVFEVSLFYCYADWIIATIVAGVTVTSESPLAEVINAGEQYHMHIGRRNKETSILINVSVIDRSDDLVQTQKWPWHEFLTPLL